MFTFLTCLCLEQIIGQVRVSSLGNFLVEIAVSHLSRGIGHSTNRQVHVRMNQLYITGRGVLKRVQNTIF